MMGAVVDLTRYQSTDSRTGDYWIESWAQNGVVDFIWFDDAFAVACCRAMLHGRQRVRWNAERSRWIISDVESPSR